MSVCPILLSIWGLRENHPSKNNLHTHNKAQALLLQRQSPNKGMPHKNPAKESDTVSVFA